VASLQCSLAHFFTGGNSRRTSVPFAPFLALLLIALFLTACASHSPRLAGPVALQGQAIPEVEEPNFTEPSPAMLRFLQEHVETGRGKERTAWSLVWAATDPYVRAFTYQPDLTLPPLETFEQQRGNCLAFSTMFMMMARHLGLDAHYQEVEIPQQWSNDNDTLLVSMHVNVVIEGAFGSNWVVDVSGRANSNSRLQRKISDKVVVAQYYNNIGANALTEDDLGKAYAYISKAIETEPDLHYLWSNLGVVYNRNNQLEAATQAYLTALSIDPNSSMAANNLYLIYEKTGNFAAAAELEKRVEKNRRKNPYYLSYLSAVAYDEGRLEESRELAERALEIQGTEYRFHYQLARTLVREGKRQEAEMSLQRAIDLAPEDLQVTMAQLDQLPDLFCLTCPE
jgi:Flp pilus assembly protein TadD